MRKTKSCVFFKNQKKGYEVFFFTKWKILMDVGSWDCHTWWLSKRIKSLVMWGLYFILTIKENLLLLLMRNIGSIMHAYINMNHGTYIQHHFVLPDLASYILLLTVASNRGIHFKKWTGQIEKKFMGPYSAFIEPNLT